MNAYFDAVGCTIDRQLIFEDSKMPTPIYNTEQFRTEGEKSAKITD